MKKINRIGNFLFYLPMCLWWGITAAWKMSVIFWPFDWYNHQIITPEKSFRGKYPFTFLWRKFED